MGNKWAHKKRRETHNDRKWHMTGEGAKARRHRTTEAHGRKVNRAHGEENRQRQSKDKKLPARLKTSICPFDVSSQYFCQLYQSIVATLYLYELSFFHINDLCANGLIQSPCSFRKRVDRLVLSFDISLFMMEMLCFLGFDCHCLSDNWMLMK